MNVTSTNGVDKSSSYKGIKTLRAALISQIKEHYKTDRHDMPEEPTGAPHNGQDVHVEAPTPAVVPNKSRREIDASLAEEARVSTGQIRAARRLVRFGNENLIVAALLGVIPISTALRAAVPPRPNARHARRQHIVDMCK